MYDPGSTKLQRARLHVYRSGIDRGDGNGDGVEAAGIDIDHSGVVELGRSAADAQSRAGVSKSNRPAGKIVQRSAVHHQCANVGGVAGAEYQGGGIVNGGVIEIDRAAKDIKSSRVVDISADRRNPIVGKTKKTLRSDVDRAATADRIVKNAAPSQGQCSLKNKIAVTSDNAARRAHAAAKDRDRPIQRLGAGSVCQFQRGGKIGDDHRAAVLNVI